MSPPDSSRRPPVVVGVAGTGTDAGKTWVGAAMLARLRAGGLHVAARKPVQSFADGDAAERTDAAILANATGETPDDVCPRHRWYPLAMAPPIAARQLAREPIALHALVNEIEWPAGAIVGLVETVGGVRSPVADDGDSAALLAALPVDHIILVADAGLGAINAVRLAVDALASTSLTVILNRFDAGDAVHRSNLAWLSDRDRVPVVTDIDACVAAVQRLVSIGRSGTGGKLIR